MVLATGTELGKGAKTDVQEFRMAALAPAATLDPSIAIAASRAGALGLLDLTLARDVAAARATIERMARQARGACGIRVEAGTTLLTLLAQRLPRTVETVLLAGDWTGCADLVRDLRRGGRTVFLEVTAASDAARAPEDVHALVAKGNESGGLVGEETTFILLQRLLAETPLPVFAHGGIGLHTAAACRCAGAAGVILDAQLLLTSESPLPEQVRTLITRMDGSETALLGADLGLPIRCCSVPAATAAERLAALSERLLQDKNPEAARVRWRRAVRTRLGWDSLERSVWPLGQDAAFARPLAERHVTTGRVLQAVAAAAQASAAGARRRRIIAEGAPLARAHGTRYPIVQGPMTRVSDSAAFAAAVAEGGALPFLSLALSRGDEVTTLLEATRERLGRRSWGVGILGFVPRELRDEQLAALRECPPPFALVAGGRPEHARELDEAGIATYLHVPSPVLLELFVRDGARRFVFEGRECGGHVGPRSSFVLWESMVSALLRVLRPAELADVNVLFAGGIHDGRSAGMVAALAEPLAEHGARIGVLLGTAYLFTREIVETGAVVRGFQREALRCVGTALLESGPGHVTRCAVSPFVETFQTNRTQLRARGVSAEDTREALEQLNLGRLRIASKGFRRRAATEDGHPHSHLAEVRETAQYAEGMYMMGQVAALRGATCTIAELHRDVACGDAGGTPDAAEPSAATGRPPPPFDVAIVGMACLLPKAPDAQTFWENILARVDAVSEVPSERWSCERYFDADPAARDKIYSRWGGFLDDVVFDPLRYGMPPASIRSIEPLQLLALEVARAALDDAGYLDRPFPRERTAVIFGAGGGVADLGHRYAIRAGLPMVLDDVPEDVLAGLPEWTEDSFPGILLNVVAGRIANRFDLGGVNYTVDAACASSLAAVQLAARELEAGTSDMVLVGGGDTVQNAFGYTCFSKTHALSPTGRCRAFDADADGIAISEGIAVLVLKRLADAERDGDRVYAVLKAVSGSSDGRDRGLTAPRPEGQALALRRAYAQAGFSPASVGLIEAHGTGTVAGDRAEVQTLRRVFEDEDAARRTCALGSVKSMIGHTKCTAGIASLMKAARALHHKVLPPTLHVERPDPGAGFDKSPFFINTDVRPWIHGAEDHPRRAGVSAFGFGGTNFHAVLEEYTGGFRTCDRQAPSRIWPAELLLWSGQSTADLLQAIEPVERVLASPARPALRDLSRTQQELDRQSGTRCLAIVATSTEDLREKLATARAALERGQSDVSDPRGIFFADAPLMQQGRLAVLFPGQGSQTCGMLGELAVQFDEVRGAFAHADAVLAEQMDAPLSRVVYPPSAFSDDERRTQAEALRATDVAQPALGAASVGVLRLLAAVGVHPQLTAGHSYGEYVALHAAGVLSEDDLYVLSRARGRAIIEAAAGEDLGTMAAVSAAAAEVHDALDGADVELANLNGPRQTVVSGARTAVAAAVTRLEGAGMQVRELPVACAFHSPLVAPARERLAVALAVARFRRPRVEVYANATAGPYPDEPAAIAALLADHLVRPVRFHEQVEAMYEAGARIFVEAGPRAVLSGLVDQILADRPHVAVAIDPPGREGLVGLLHALGRLAAHGVPIDLGRVHAGRDTDVLDLDALVHDGGAGDPPATAWLVNGGRARPLRDDGQVPKPRAAGAPAAAPSASTGGSANGTSLVPLRALPSALAPPGAPARAALPTRVAARPATRSLPVAGRADGAMTRHQQLMRRFVEQQEAVMLAYLSRGGAAHVGAPRRPRLPPDREQLPRFTLEAVETRPPAGVDPPRDGALIITDDERGIATDLAARLSRQGGPAAGLGGAVPVVLRASELRDLGGAASTVAELRERHGGVAGLVHLAGLRAGPDFEELDAEAWRARLASDVEPLFLLARASADDLARPGARIFAATAMGATFAVDPTAHSFDPRHGALVGFVKTAATEWPQAVARVVDLDLDELPAQCAEHLYRELIVADGEIEIAWSATRRTAPRLRPSPLGPGVGRSPLHEGSVVLVTGGARGITAEVALELAERHRPRLVLAGRTPLPAEPEPEETARLASVRELRAALMKQLGSGARPPAPAEVEVACSRLLRAREVVRSIDAMRAVGATVEYHQVDVGDSVAIQRLVGGVYAAHGRIDGVIHGAGVIEDSLIADKDIASLRRVLAAKAVAAIALSRALRPDDLRFLVLFGSVAGRFGNRGQADYAAANQVLSKLAAYLDRRWPARVVAIDWAPWSDTGMAAGEVGERLEALGMRRVAPAAGRRALDRELRLGRKGEAEVILGDGPWAAAAEPVRPVLETIAR